MNTTISKIFLLVFFFLLTTKINAQTALQPWGNMEGIRIEGQLMKFETSLGVASSNGSGIQSTGKERQRPKYSRNGNQQVVTTNIDSVYFTETVKDIATGMADVQLQIKATAGVETSGVYFALQPDNNFYANGSIQINNLKPVPIGQLKAANSYLQNKATALLLSGDKRQLKLIFKTPVTITATDNANGIQLLIAIQTGNIKKDQTATLSFTIKASGIVDKAPVTFALNTAAPGRIFDGLGGNFRLQNPRTDPQVIDYCLQNLRVAWGRVEMPWRFWQPAIDTNPITQAKAGKLNVQVKKAMEMAQRLHQLGMPVILTAWSGPAWAVVGKPKFRPGPDGVWGNPLDTAKTQEIYKSIADYIGYVKEEYGFEFSMFSFNESDLGINIRQTGVEHATLIKGLGAYFVSRGFKTKLLLGDNSDATTYNFIDAALNDPATHPYIGAVSFHSWRGWENETLQHWADAATKLKLPLLVGEGSIDAAAWAYPAIFNEQIYSLEEINLYTRLLAICQPASILQWQLTADYSPLAGGGIFGDTSALRPLQRFFNLKQLAATQPGLQSMPIESGAKDISAAALGDYSKGLYAFHFVNNGAARKVTVTGIPTGVKSLQLFVTDKKKSMKQQKDIPVINGKATLMLAATSFTSLMNGTEK